MLLLLLASAPAAAELVSAFDDQVEPSALPGGEILTIAMMVITASIKLLAGYFIRRDAIHDAGTTPLDPDVAGLARVGALLGIGPAGMLGAGRVVVRDRHRRQAEEVFRSGNVLRREAAEAADLSPALAIERWSPDFSEPLFLDMTESVYRALIARRGHSELDAFEGVVLPGARESLLRTGRGVPDTAVQTGPARLVRASADELWLSVDVMLGSLVVEDQPGGPRTLLRVDVLRLQRRTDATEAAPEDWRAAVARAEAGEGMLLPPDLGGWVVGALLSDRIGEPGLATLREVDGNDASPVGRPPRGASATLDADLRAFGGRHPEADIGAVLDRVREWAGWSLQARAAGTDALPPSLAAVLSPLVVDLHAFWAAVAGAIVLPRMRLSATDRFLPAAASVGAVRPLRITLDPLLEIIDVLVEVSQPPHPGDPVDEGHHRHEEVWRIGRRIGSVDAPLQVIDIKWAPAPVG